MSERPIRTAAQIAEALDVTPGRARALLQELEDRGHVELHGGGWRATAAAWETYPRPAGAKALQMMTRIRTSTKAA